MVVFLFSTLLKVGHAVVLHHILCRRDVNFFKWGPLKNVDSSKTQQNVTVHKIPFAKSESYVLCAVFLLENHVCMYSKGEADFLFSSKKTIQKIDFQ